MGIHVRDPNQPIGTMSGGERQRLAIARAIHFGARVLILDEPTAALGVKQSFNVLKLIHKARERGISVIFITHNVHHAYPIGDSFTLGIGVQERDTFSAQLERRLRERHGGEGGGEGEESGAPERFDFAAFKRRKAAEHG